MEAKESSGGAIPPVTDDDHVRGRRDAPVVLVEYADYECPYCGRAYWAIKRLLEELGDEVAFVFRNFPVTEAHPRAENVAEALEAAAAQGRFWEMHDWFYEHQHQLEGLDLERHARALGIDIERWKANLRDHACRDRVQRDVVGASEAGVTGTPTLFVNGLRYDGPPDFPSLLAAVRRARDSRDEQDVRASR